MLVRLELATALTLRAGKAAEEVLVDAASRLLHLEGGDVANQYDDPATHKRLGGMMSLAGRWMR
jgi:hypothetical protein